MYKCLNKKYKVCPAKRSPQLNAEGLTLACDNARLYALASSAWTPASAFGGRTMNGRIALTSMMPAIM